MNQQRLQRLVDWHMMIHLPMVCRLVQEQDHYCQDSKYQVNASSLVNHDYFQHYESYVNVHEMQKGSEYCLELLQGFEQHRPDYYLVQYLVCFVPGCHQEFAQLQLRLELYKSIIKILTSIERDILKLIPTLNRMCVGVSYCYDIK